MQVEAAEKFHALPVDEVLARLGSRPDGLSEAEAQERLQRFGPNTFRSTKPVPAWRILLDQVRSVIVVLLFLAAVLSLALGDPLDAAAIGAVLVINTTLGFITEMRARRAMEALLRLDVPHALVIREGRLREIDARQLVPGDVIRLEAGQAVPADARLIDATDLQVGEAPLTGESLPVPKDEPPVPEDSPLPDRHSMVYKGTTVLAGSARAVVVATGMETELGRIGTLVGGIEEERTPLERRLDALGHRLVWVALAVAAVVIGIGAAQGAPLGRMFEAGIALAIAAVPEGLPAVATIALAVGVRRMVRRNALVRRLPSVETLGSVTVVCTDKTGTLTAGQMMVTNLWVPEREIQVTGAGYAPEGTFLENGRELDPATDPQLGLLLRIASLANRAEVERAGTGWVAHGDPTEAALLVAARKAGLDRGAVLREWPEIGEVPFSSQRMLMATFNRAPDGGLVAHVKGAPGRLIDLCTSVLTEGGERPLDEAMRRRLSAENEELARRGLRVLAFASGRVQEASESALRGLTFVGYAGMIDPPAPGVKETIRIFREAGIRTVMITGDQRLTAEAVARDLGILGPEDEVLDGRELDRMPEEELAERVTRVAAFSRVSPEDKLKIVTAYQRQGEIVAMLGDGVNDAAALKKADVGVAMGIAGTDVAKEASAVVLQDDRFLTIGAAVEEGRVVFDNIRKFVFYLFSCNLAEVLVLLGAAIAGLPLPLTPLQILWLNLVTDTFPALSLALEPAEPGLMRRPPRNPKEAILSGPFLRRIFFYSTLITVSTLAAFMVGFSGAGGAATQHAVTLSFMTLALAQTFHLANARSAGQVLEFRKAVSNPYALGAVVLVLLLQLVAVYFDPLSKVLGTYPLSGRDWLVVAGLALIPAAVGQTIKLIAGMRRPR